MAGEQASASCHICYLQYELCTVGKCPFELPLRYASMPLIKKAIGLLKFPADMDGLQ